jgi:hypothetical protein
MIAPEFAAGVRVRSGQPPQTFWSADVIQDVRIHIIPQQQGHEIIVTEPCSTGESYGVFPSLEVAYLEACVIFADILEADQK